MLRASYLYIPQHLQRRMPQHRQDPPSLVYEAAQTPQTEQQRKRNRAIGIGVGVGIGVVALVGATLGMVAAIENSEFIGSSRAETAF